MNNQNHKKHVKKNRKINFKKLLTLSNIYSILNMDLSKVPNEKKLYLCRSYFRIGFFLLPFVWLVNAVWFFNEGFRKPDFEEQKYIKKYVIFSAIGTTIWFIALLSWVIVFQLNRANWGEFADYISFLIPVGTP